jgi:type IV secretory pathway VirB10-like protein
MPKLAALATCLTLAACASTSKAPRQTVEARAPAEPAKPELQAQPAPAANATPAEPPLPPESPIVLRVSYGNLGTQSGSEWAVHADGAIRGRACNEPRERQLSADAVSALRESMVRCKLCELPERHPSGANADKEIYRVEASWPDLRCETDVSLQSRFHYDARAKRCHAILEDLLHARVTFCPDDELAP